MLFQGKVDRAMKYQAEKNQKPDEEREEELTDPRQEYEEEPISKKLEKGDIPAMLISAIGVLIPAAVIVMLGLVFLSRLLLNLL